jgi:hypothetical protein
VNSAAQKVFDAIKEATKNSASGGGVLSSGSFRLLWEPKEYDNTPAELVKQFDRNELAQEFLDAVGKDQFKFFDAMKAQLQHDMVAAAHRDMSLRYSNRIHRILEEAGRRKSIQRDNSGMLAVMQANVEKFLAVEEGKE